MTCFELFDSVKLTEAVPLGDDGSASVGTPGAIVEVLNDGEAYLVELFGNWVKTDAEGDFIPTELTDPEAFMETLGVETVYPQQMRLVQPARETMGDRGRIVTLLDQLPEVCDFAEFLHQKHQKQASPS